ncbi:MAG: hypothetical protein DRN03_04160 [Thermoplasmata archaeon]|nr:MAG: hypothetical protein DRN03_04160 [Thermoplasmata archaeon]
MKKVLFTQLECPKCKSRNYDIMFYKQESIAKLKCRNCGTTALVEVYAKVYQVIEHKSQSPNIGEKKDE